MLVQMHTSCRRARCQKIGSAMKPAFLFGDRPLACVFGPLAECNAIKRAKWCTLFAASCRELQASGLCSPESSLPRPGTCITLIATLMICLGSSTGAVTLEQVLEITIERNPAIQEAKAGLEQAAGQRLVFRSIVWPHAELVCRPVCSGHRAGSAERICCRTRCTRQTLFNLQPHPFAAACLVLMRNSNQTLPS